MNFQDTKKAKQTILSDEDEDIITALQHPVTKLFKWIHYLLMFTGLPLYTDRNFSLSGILRLIYSWAVFLLLTVSAALSVRFWITDIFNSVDSIVVQRLVFTLFYSCGSVTLFFIVHWQRRKMLLKQSLLLFKANAQCGVQKHRLQILIFSGCAIVALVALVSTVIAQLVLFADFQESFPSFNEQRLLYFDERLFPLLLFTYFYICIIYVVGLIMFLAICVSSEVEFAMLNSQLEEERKIDATVLKPYLQKYYLLVDSVGIADRNFKCYLLLMFGTTIPTIILVIYVLMTNSNVMEKIFFICGVLTLSPTILLLTILPAKVHSEASRTVEVLLDKIKCTDLEGSAKLSRLVNWFVTKATHKPVGITIGGILLVTNNFLLTAFSVIFSLLTFLIQSYTEMQNIVHANNQTNGTSFLNSLIFS